ncbi:MAG: hypothetical protein K8R39_03955 [Arcobacteraceae bacterium]|nr:hypothetical protein [Arcobacteraceae bacterium]
MNDTNKLELIDEIKQLISVDGSSIDINPNYLEYFELEELEDIKQQLLHSKSNAKSFTKEYVEELYEKFSQ